jgi:putative membrane protein
MNQKKQPKLKDKYFVPLDEKLEIPLPVTVSETEKFDLSGLESFSLKPRKLKYLKPLMWGMGILVVSLTSWELVRFIQVLYEWHWSAAAVAGTIGLVTTGLLIKVIWEFFGHQRELTQVGLLREQSDKYLSENQYGQSKQWLRALRSLYEDKPQAALLDAALKSIPDYNSDAEVVHHMAEHFYPKLDELALKRITAYSQQTAVLIAMSPLALLDLVLVLWRNVRMIDEIGQIYGLRPSRIGRIKLYRQLINSMMLASATELISDYWTDFSSASLSNVVSTRVAQGMGVGLYTARIGIKTMALCRPLSFSKKSQPGITTLLPHIKAVLVSKIGGKD